MRMSDKSDPPAESQDEGFNRDRSPINRTEAAMMSRGIDSVTAARLRKSSWTLTKLKRSPEPVLRKLGLRSEVITTLRAEKRPEIPYESLVQVLVANRFMCCVCHDASKSVIVHHIREWSVSHDHSSQNLAVLCLDHHDKAHSTSTLTRNLDERTLEGFKKAWEEEVNRYNATAILDASRSQSDAWLYFNHLRLFELAAHYKLPLNRLPRYHTAFAANLLNPDGTLRPRSKSLAYLYEGGEGIPLHLYMIEVMEAVLSSVAVLNISDYLDRSLLSPIARRGDLLFVQGAHSFRKLNRRSTGPNQTTSGVRRANHVEVSFTFDRWEATSGSAHNMWLHGHQDAASLVRLNRVEHAEGKLKLVGTVIGIAIAFEGLKTREYATFPYRRGVTFDEGEEEEEFDSF